MFDAEFGLSKVLGALVGFGRRLEVVQKLLLDRHVVIRDRHE